MNPLEDDLRLTLRRHALDANAVPAPTWEAPTQRPWRSRPWFLPTIAAASALVFVAGAGVAVTTLASSPTPAAAPIPLSTIVIDPSSAVTSSETGGAASSSGSVAGSIPYPTSTPTPTLSSSRTSTADDVPAKSDEWVPPVRPKGYNAWSYRGVEVYLSKSYKLNAWECGMPQDTTVIVGDYPTTCPTSGPMGGVYDAGIVALLPAESEAARESIPYLTKRVDIGGVTAYVDRDCKKCTGTRLLGASAMYFPKQRVVVHTELQLIEPTRDILATVHVRD